ncbi:synaptotagmin-like protein 4 [Melanotaenia boesemani]|uniref:synaptotagmin-like protein 4 n=1 Tax=Melanotaenia boesemani TaxID=1250792 RepID=UPI001C03B480|nr:synaptotagmin-like protein 4 [Melanotaenia boesemani]XP_041845950.1 synaptotagmin-like protein 4 [Melanotaenia boesemani]
MVGALDMINLSFLSDSEQEMILEVLRRDEELRLVEEQRVRKLKAGLLEVKRKGAKRGSGKYSQHSCGRCQQPLSRLTVFSNQCKMCNHYVCRNCQTVLPNGSWLCSVCVKESDMKKKTGDWFYNQRINRFSEAPGHNLVRASLKKRLPLTKRETTGQLILESVENMPNPAKPVPLPRLKNQPVNKSHSGENSGSIASRESLESKSDKTSKPSHSDTESAEKGSIASSKNATESGSATPEQPRPEHHSVPSSPSGSSISSLTVPVRVNNVSDGPNSITNTAMEVKPVSLSPENEVDRLFKKSKRVHKPAECVSTLDLRVGCDAPEASMGYRSQSVPGLDVQGLQEDEEEDEDIDSLVNFHKRAMGSSSPSLQSSKSTLGSLMSIYSEAGDFDTVEVTGDVVFSISYNEHTKSLQVFIKECRNLAFGNASRQLSNPYVKCYLLPDKSRHSKRKTSIKSNTINPVYNETLKYSISRSQLVTRSMLISVWHHGRLSRNTFLGEVEVALDCRDLSSPCEDQMQLMAKVGSVVPASAFVQYKGELIISLKYITPEKANTEKAKGKKAAPAEGELHVLIKEAKNLIAVKSKGSSDSFVKGFLFPTKEKTTKRKTAVVKKNLNPHYDTTFVYKEVTLKQLRGMCLELTVWDEAKLSNDFLGGVRLSSGQGTVKVGKEEVELDSVGEEVSLWEKMMQYPDSWAEGTLPLRTTMGKAKAK